MPTSHQYQINEIVELITLAQPNKVLDIGAGFGKYGFLTREFLELWDGRETIDNWQRTIEGVEAFENYLTPVHDYIYDKIHKGTIQETLPSLGDDYDMIMMIDVFEHFDYDEGVQILKDCLKKSKYILMSIPRDIGDQGEAFENPLEEHKFQWRAKHFKDFGPVYFLPNPYSLICLIGNGAPDIGKKRNRRALGGVAMRILDFLHLRKV